MQVPLVIVLGQVEGAAELGVQPVDRSDRRHAGAQTQAGQLALEQVADPVGGGGLGGCRRPHGRAVLGADVVAMPVGAGRVVVLPESAQQRLATRSDDGGVVDRPHRLGMAGGPGADLLIGGVRRRAAHVSDGRGHDAGQTPQDPLHAPEAAARQVDHLGALRPGAVQRTAEDDMIARFRQQAGLAAGDRGVSGRDPRGRVLHGGHTTVPAVRGTGARNALARTSCGRGNTCRCPMTAGTAGRHLRPW